MASEFEDLQSYNWQPQSEAAMLVNEILDGFRERCPAIAGFGEQLHWATGTRLIDWIDSAAIPASEDIEARLSRAGFTASRGADGSIWRHAGGLFPVLETHRHPVRRIAIGVESVADFLVAHFRDERTPIEGGPLGQLRRAKVADGADAEFWVVERHGCSGWEVPHPAGRDRCVLEHAEHLRRRRRSFDDPSDGFDHAGLLIRAAVDDLGAAWACDLFFAAEREYWTRRNRAARVQKARQDELGVGWANHDHHTYRSSREHFAALIAVLEKLGLVCRERFYAGLEAGWGAQVLEHPEAGIVVFADVDLSPDEVTGDFAHQPLAARDELGTVGLWCKLHGEAFLQAGMHHLECQFDFDAAREQLAQAGIRTMKPFSDLPCLKQAFTEGEVWRVDRRRIDAALAAGAITAEHAEQFRQQGAIGSHLEILQRDQGYKGFNQEGISQIIHGTDPRRQV